MLNFCKKTWKNPSVYLVVMLFFFHHSTGTENTGTGSLRRQRPVDIVVSDGGDPEDSGKKARHKTASSLPLPPPKNGIFKMLSKALLQNLLARIANNDEFYRGLDEAGSEVPPGVTGGGGPRSFELFKGSSSQPPSLLGRSGFTPLYKNLC